MLKRYRQAKANSKQTMTKANLETTKAQENLKTSKANLEKANLVKLAKTELLRPMLR